MTSTDQYVEEVLRWESQLGMLHWVAPQDWMCEPWIIEKTGLSVDEHQWRTVDNFLELRERLGHRVIPVLQGWTLDEYHWCWEMYEQEGVDLLAEPTVGIGSVCRRQNEDEIKDIVCYFADTGMRLHGFGVKTQGFKKYARCLESADSMAWSYRARREGVPMYPECTSHKACQNCKRWAHDWARKINRVLRGYEENTSRP
jgi:hypothetical protein